ncbi:MAG: hypothetical protein PHR90_04775 [Sphaerochaetaceae bacterium]|jgi:hypothetical protein|nr:hypothetical protein [Sphaerochaetaceae bacterium]MDX9809760.1 hypothetical protein [Sphaerochaetaceae bacterium]
MDDMELSIRSYYESLGHDSQEFLDSAVKSIIETKEHGGKVIVVTGSGPNLHEGITTLIAHLMAKGVIDGVTTSSAVVAHEMGGALDKVKRIKVPQSKLIGTLDPNTLPRGDIFELTLMDAHAWNMIRREMPIDDDLVRMCEESEGQVIIKAAGNMAYPMGLRTETVANTIHEIARICGKPFEEVAGWGCDEQTMLGIGAKMHLPVLVSIPQLVGGGYVGIAVGDSISIAERSARIADMLANAEVIIESAVALTQEIHDGPFETYTGHGIWADWNGHRTYSLKKKNLIRFDLDENLKRAWELDKFGGDVQRAIDQGLPKTKMSKIPFRMEMSAFCRLESSIPVIGDIGVIWPVVAYKVCKALGIELEFLSHPQQTEQGKSMREYIVSQVKPVDLDKIRQTARTHMFN